LIADYNLEIVLRWSADNIPEKPESFLLVDVAVLDASFRCYTRRWFRVQEHTDQESLKVVIAHQLIANLFNWNARYSEQVSEYPDDRSIQS